MEIAIILIFLAAIILPACLAEDLNDNQEKAMRRK